MKAEEARVHYQAGVKLADLGREDEALREWRTAVELDPELVDAHYNLGQLHYNFGHHELALEAWRKAEALAPTDFEIAKKVVQALNALGRGGDAEAATARLVELWRSASAPDVQRLVECVIDQLVVAGHRVMAYETLRPAREELYAVYSFRALDSDGRAVLAVQLESSAYGRETGAPFVFGVSEPNRHRTVGPVYRSRPSYGEVKARAMTLLEESLRERAERLRRS
jgi:tetratricopeptide (TPR) repeat protein